MLVRVVLGRSLVLMIAALLGGGCAGWTSVAPLSVGPVAPSPATYAQVETLLLGRGYQVLRSNPGSGTIEVQAQTGSWRASYSLTLQCYREGWVSLIPSGPGVRRTGRHWTLPGALSSEYLELAIALHSLLPQTSGGM